MVGIYLITNKTNGKQYVGQSVDIARRWMEHKTPKASGNDRLHGDMQKLGVEQFDFEVIEECEEGELNVRELHYICELEPFYNYIGKKRTKEQREKISAGMKKWWNNLPEESKRKVIDNNLTGPKVGHEVSAETRRKISEAVSKNQKRKVMIVETGEVFESIGDMERHLGACPGTHAAYKRGAIKSVKGFQVVECRD